eukprot:SAG11_NODE_6197_length_1367_cov_1.216877_1_plen_161_part_00
MPPSPHAQRAAAPWTERSQHLDSRHRAAVPQPTPSVLQQRLFLTPYAFMLLYPAFEVQETKHPGRGGKCISNTTKNREFARLATHHRAARTAWRIPALQRQHRAREGRRPARGLACCIFVVERRARRSPSPTDPTHLWPAQPCMIGWAKPIHVLPMLENI